MDLLAHHDPHRSNLEQQQHLAAEQLIAQFANDVNGGSNVHQQDLAVKLPVHQGNQQWLQQSWLLMLFVAPILVAILVWLLVLLRRRARQTLGKLATTNHMRLAAANLLKVEQGSQSNKTDHSGSAFLLDSSQATNSSASSSSSSSSSRSSAELEASKRRLEERWVQLERQQRQVSSLVRHTNQYLASLTYQEIVACAVAFTIAILNVVRMRNLFCCNLVIFVLITSRLLNLLTLATFTCTKLWKLVLLQPLTIYTHVPSSNHAKQKQQDPKATSSKTILSNRRRPIDEEEILVSETSCANQHDGSPTDININVKPARNSSPVAASYEDTTGTGGTRTATICRLIVGKQEHHRDSHKRVENSSSSSCSPSSRVNLRKSSTKMKMEMEKEKSSCCRLIGLGLASALVALVCLYLRLMGHTPAIIHHNQSNSSWSVAIQYAPTTTTTSTTTTTTTTEASTRYNQGQTTTSYHAGSWSSRANQQASNLRHLIDQYELQAFLQLLLDLNLQTSRFACTLSSAGYGSIAKLAMSCLYFGLMLLVCLLSFAISRLGSRRLRQIQRASLTLNMTKYDGNNKVQDDTANWHQLLLQHHHRSPLNLVGSNGRTDSNRKRYSDLLKQSMRHHQSALDMMLVAGGQQARQTLAQHHQLRAPVLSWQQQAKLGDPRRPTTRPQLRNSSSMSSLLAPLPLQPTHLTASCERTQTGAHLSYLKHQQQQRRRLVSVQSMASLNLGGSPQVSSSKVPAGKLASSGGHLAWLPLGSAATVASLSNIGNSPTRAPSQQHYYLGGKQQHYRLSGSLDERDEGLDSSNNGSSSSLTTPKQDHNARNKSNRRAEVAQSQSQSQSPSSMEPSVEEWKWEQEEAGARSRQAYLELNRDLRLSQALILFGQLLDHAPILLLLLAAIFLPDNPQGDHHLAATNWTSGHDNAFVWLSLVQALALPVLLLSLDKRLSLALRRSLSCSSGRNELLQRHHHLPPPVGSGAKQLSRQQHLKGDLVLGPSASHPDFMFACSQPHLNSATAHALTGPPYPARHERPLAVDTRLDLGLGGLMSNQKRSKQIGVHAVGSNLEALQGGQYAEMANKTTVVGSNNANGRLARRRQRRRTGALLRATRKLFRFGKPLKSSSSRCSHQGPRSSNLNLSGFDHYHKPQASIYDQNNNNNSNSVERSRGEGPGGNLSPTSSLSTLIRKFNHDNYTSVCQQYERRKQQLEVESMERRLRRSKGNQKQEMLLIDGLSEENSNSPSKGDSTTIMTMTNTTNTTTVGDTLGLNQDQAILCRKGGLYYNYSLEEPALSDTKAKINPMLSSTSALRLQSARRVDSTGATVQQPAGEQEQKTAKVQEEPAGRLRQQPTMIEGRTKEDKKSKSSSKNRNQAELSSTCPSSSPSAPEAQEALIKSRETRDFQETTAKMTKSAAGPTNGNNEPIISNINSVQELLDRMNGMMMMGSHGNGLRHSKSSGRFNRPPTKEAAGQVDERAAADEVEIKEKQQQPGRKQQRRACGNQNNKSILAEMMIGNGCNDNRSKQQLSAAAAGGANQRTPAQVNGGLRSVANQGDTLDYSTLRSVDDALSLVSVSSEFEYHNINQAPQISLNESSKSTKTPVGKTAVAQTEPQKDPNANLLFLSSTSSSSSSASIDASKKLEDLRFPSFLPTKPVPGSSATNQTVQVALNPKQASSSHFSELVTPPRFAAGNKGAKSKASNNLLGNNSSSSLLNLTAAKFAALSSTSNNNSSGSQVLTQTDQRQLPLNLNLILQTAGSSNTITKQKAQAASDVRNLATNLAENELSLPAESGNVRARIRKMEQQSTPNLTTDSSQQQEQVGRLSNSNIKRPPTVMSSMIPVNASKLPVPTSGQLTSSSYKQVSNSHQNSPRLASHHTHRSGHYQATEQQQQHQKRSSKGLIRHHYH